MYEELMIHMAQSLEIEIITAEHKSKDKMLSCLYLGFSGIIDFPILEGLEDLTQKIGKSQHPCNQPLEGLSISTGLKRSLFKLSLSPNNLSSTISVSDRGDAT